MHEQYDQLIDSLSRARRVLLTTHVRPDGDALGTVAAVALGLRQRGIDSSILLLSHLPTKYAFVLKDAGLDHIDAESGIPASLEFDRFDALLVCDTGTWSQLPGLRERLAWLPKQKLVLDHHLTQEDWADLRVVDTTAGAAGEMAEMLLQRWGLTITPQIAQALFVAIASDTGWFQFSNTTPRTMRLVADLMERGVDTDRLYQLLYQNERAARLRTQQRAMQSLQLHADDRLAIMTLTADDLRAAGASVNDTENLVNVPLMVRTVEVSVLITEDPAGGPTRVSLRSKGGINCAEYAARHAGGGHARAAGAKFTQLPGEVARLLRNELESMLRQHPGGQ